MLHTTELEDIVDTQTDSAATNCFATPWRMAKLTLRRQKNASPADMQFY
jgi:hypothetical protein